MRNLGYCFYEYAHSFFGEDFYSNTLYQSLLLIQNMIYDQVKSIRDPYFTLTLYMYFKLYSRILIPCAHCISNLPGNSYKKISLLAYDNKIKLKKFIIIVVFKIFFFSIWHCIMFFFFYNNDTTYNLIHICVHYNKTACNTQNNKLKSGF